MVYKDFFQFINLVIAVISIVIYLQNTYIFCKGVDKNNK